MRACSSDDDEELDGARTPIDNTMAAQTASSSRPLAYVDVDIDDARADYA